MADSVQCSCCGKWIVDSPASNIDFETRGCDTGFGHCKECYGDPKAKDVKAQIGWAACMFCESRFDIIRKSLKEDSQKKWDGLTYAAKCAFVVRAVDKGIII